MAAATPTVAIESLSVSYRTKRGTVAAVRDVSLAVRPGEAVALIGESGSGKSTVALSLMRLLAPNARITGGRIEFATPSGVRDVLRLSERELRAFRWAECALVPQGAISALNPVMRISEHFEDTAAAHDYLSGRDLRRRASDVLGSVRLDPERVLRAYPHELSGGMRQRVLIALALLLEPRLLILDEPTTALDILTQRSILEILIELQSSSAFSLLFISHDLALAGELCDRLVTMYAGRAIEVAPTRELMAAPRHPYTIALLRAIPSLVATNETVAAIPGWPPDPANLPPGCPFAPRCPLAVALCEDTDPPLVSIAARHAVACHRWADAETLLGPEVRASA